MNDKFPLLSILSGILRIFGSLLLLPSLYFFLWEGIIEPMLPNHRWDSFGQGNLLQGDLIQILAGLLGCLIAIGVIATGEIIGVFFAIEKNTRQSCKVNS